MGIKELINRFNDWSFQVITGEKPYTNTKLKRELIKTGEVLGLEERPIMEYGKVKILEERFANEEIFFFSHQWGGEWMEYIIETEKELKILIEKVKKEVKQSKDVIFNIKKSLENTNTSITFDEILYNTLNNEIYYDVSIDIFYKENGKTIIGHIENGESDKELKKIMN